MQHVITLLSAVHRLVILLKSMGAEGWLVKLKTSPFLSVTGLTWAAVLATRICSEFEAAARAIPVGPSETEEAGCLVMVQH